VLKDVVRGRDRGRPSERADKARREARRCLYSGGLRGNQCGLHRQDNAWRLSCEGDQSRAQPAISLRQIETLVVWPCV